MDTIKDMLSRLALMCRLEVAIVSELEKLGSRVTALEENRKLKDAAIKQLTTEVQELRLMLRQQTAPKI